MVLHRMIPGWLPLVARAEEEVEGRARCLVASVYMIQELQATTVEMLKIQSLPVKVTTFSLKGRMSQKVQPDKKNRCLYENRLWNNWKMRNQVQTLPQTDIIVTTDPGQSLPPLLLPPHQRRVKREYTASQCPLCLDWFTHSSLR